MTRRAVIFVLAVVVGLGLSTLSTGKWPHVSARSMTWGAEERETGVPRVEAYRLAGLMPVDGTGVRITIDDAEAKSGVGVPMERLIVHERDLLRLRNELFAAGARAVAINGQRMVATSVIRCVGPAIRINDVNTAPPYVIEAVGDPRVLKRAVLMIGGVVDILSLQKLRVNVATVKKMHIAAYSDARIARMRDGAPPRETKKCLSAL